MIVDRFTYNFWKYILFTLTGWALLWIMVAIIFPHWAFEIQLYVASGIGALITGAVIYRKYPNWFKKNKNKFTKTGLNFEYSDNGRGMLNKIYETINGQKHGLFHLFNDIGELHYSQLWNKGKYGGPRYRKSITKRTSEIVKNSNERGKMLPEEIKEVNAIDEKVQYYKNNERLEEKISDFEKEKQQLMKIQNEGYPSIEDKKGTAWD